VETHTCGEPTRIVTMLDVPGDTMVAKQEYFRAHLDHVRRALVREPRGHRDMFGAVLTRPVTPDAAAGVIWLDHAGYLSGCGHATIAVGIAMVETGQVAGVGAPRCFSLDSPSGLLRLRVAVRDGRARETTFENVPAFVVGLELPVEVPGVGRVGLDVAFGGNFFAALDAASVGLAVVPEQASRLAALGLRIREAANAQLRVQHPVLPHLQRIQIVTFREAARRPGARYRQTHVFGEGQVDRSPGGTGTSAMLAVLHARGELALGQEVEAEGILGGVFRGRLLRPAAVGPLAGVVPEVTGPAFITAHHQFVLDPDDPWREGFQLG
jgi:proline racemase/trans-L-3-hydroxyproline dehydratase